VAEQVADPLGVPHVGLAAGDRLDVVGVADDQLEVALEDRVDRLPVDPGALHCDVRHAL
jgi:hypothetical protein